MSDDQTVQDLYTEGHARAIERYHHFVEALIDLCKQSNALQQLLTAISPSNVSIFPSMLSQEDIDEWRREYKAILPEGTGSIPEGKIFEHVATGLIRKACVTEMVRVEELTYWLSTLFEVNLLPGGRRGDDLVEEEIIDLWLDNSDALLVFLLEGRLRE